MSPVIVLRTACGCEQQRAWPDLPPEIRVPLYRPGASVSLNDAVTITVRRFVARGMTTEGVPLYVERDEGQAERPQFRPLSSDEWAAAVARFQRDNILAPSGHEDAKRAASWATADLDFLRRHDGGVIVYHQPTRSLVGAFYPAPSWDASEDCVRFWSALRRTLEDEPQP